MNLLLNIKGSGIYLPKKIVNSSELDKKYGFSEGTTYKRTGVKQRYYIENETNAFMAKEAILSALHDAQLELSDIDCIVATSGTQQQPIPCNGALIQRELGLGESGIPAFDVNSTCLSFLLGMDLMSYPLSLGRYKNIVLVSSEISSVGLNFDNFEGSSLFGDGAVAFIFSQGNKEDSSKILATRFETYSIGAHYTEISGGGSYIHPREYPIRGEKDFTFNMDGRAVVRLSAKYSKGFMEKLLEEAGLQMEDIKYIIPHQASPTAIKIIGKKMSFIEERVIKIIENTGNIISACIPMTWHYLRKNYTLNKGDKILLVGTSAGLSIGAIIIEF